MSKRRPRIPDPQLKILFTLSGNKCAFPGCPNLIIEEGSESAPEVPVGQVCHIYSISQKGPRANPGLTERQRNMAQNLILLCAHHHQIVDKQEAKYPADLLQEYKRKRESAQRRAEPESLTGERDAYRTVFVQQASDQRITAELERLRKGRFFAGFDFTQVARGLARALDAGELIAGSPPIRSDALAFCARLLAFDDPAYASELVKKATTLSLSESVSIAKAFVLAAQSPDEALKDLAVAATPDSRSAALRVVTRTKGSEAALDWVRRTGLKFDDLNSEGKLNLLTAYLETSRWNEAIEVTDKLTTTDFKTTPALYNAAGFGFLIRAATDDLKQYIIAQVPFEAAEARLSSDPAAMKARRRAIDMFQRASEAGQAFGVASSSNAASDYALWLRLLDAKQCTEAIEELRDSLSDPGQSLRRVNLALRFGIKLDISAIETEIDRVIAFDGAGTADAAAARLAIAFTKGSPEKVAAYLAQHRESLHRHLNKPYLQTIEIEILAHAGDLDAARKRYEEYVADLGTDEKEHIERILAEKAGADPAEQRRLAFEKSGHTRDLINLVSHLLEKKKWDELCVYAEKLFYKTHSLDDALTFAQALSEAKKYSELLELLRGIDGLVSESPLLRELQAWTLYRAGQFREAAVRLQSLRQSRDHPNDRKLALRLSIASGRWDDLIEVTNADWKAHAGRSAEELLLSGQLAQFVGAPHGRDLIKEAAARAPRNPNILIGAYAHAVSGGWEREGEVFKWLRTAAARSGTKGPVQKMDLKELARRQPEWQEREEFVWRNLNAGSAPASAAAETLNRSLLDLHLTVALSNVDQKDPRRRGVVFAYSGARRTMPRFAKVKRIALDVTAIITLAHLGFLREVISTYEQVHIAHSTLGWLLQEQQTSTFQQPSRIQEAHLLDRLVATGVLKVLTPAPIADRVLLREVGRDLTQLIEAAITKRSTSEFGQYVVRSSPVHRAGSFAAEAADLKRHWKVLCGCQAVVHALRAKGALTKVEADNAIAFLALQERSWPKEPKISPKAELYLDGLSVAYFQSVKLLDRLEAADFSYYILDSELQKARELMAIEHVGARRTEIIERIRATLSDGIAAGRILATAEIDGDGNLSSNGKNHPTAAILQISAEVDALVIDDRFMNSHPFLEQASRKIPIATSLEILEQLTLNETISLDQHMSALTLLRKSGYQLIPTSSEELIYHIKNAGAGEFVETAELRAIREAIERLRMSKSLQNPTEVPWLQSTSRSLLSALRWLWFGQYDAKMAAAYSSWIVRLLDLRGWSPIAIHGNERNFALYAHASQVLQLATLGYGHKAPMRERYNSWLDQNLIEPLRNTEPEMFIWLRQRATEMMHHLVREASGAIKDG